MGDERTIRKTGLEIDDKRDDHRRDRIRPFMPVIYSPARVLCGFFSNASAIHSWEDGNRFLDNRNVRWTS